MFSEHQPSVVLTASTRRPSVGSKNPFTLTSKAGDMSKYQDFLNNETRYSRLARAFPERAQDLFNKNQKAAEDRYEHLTRLVDLYK